jgi:hypothetical protein
MTHDELLIEINRRLDVALYNGDPQIAHALRAVVELHSPLSGWVDGIEVENHHCSCDPYNEYDMGYPCETVQVIEEQLK